MKPNLSRWIKSVRDTQVEEITCSECLDQVSQYVDLELASGQAARQMPRVKQHLDLPIYEPRREDQVFANVTGHNTGPLTPDTVTLSLNLTLTPNAMPGKPIRPAPDEVIGRNVSMLMLAIDYLIVLSANLDVMFDATDEFLSALLDGVPWLDVAALIVSVLSLWLASIALPRSNGPG